MPHSASCSRCRLALPSGPAFSLSDRRLAPGARDSGRFQMHPNRVVDGSAIASSNGHDDRQADLPTVLEHQSVPARQAIKGETKATESISLMRIGTREIDHEIRL